MNKADFKKQLKEVFEHNIDGLTWNEKMNLICGTLFEVDKAQVSNKESAITKSTRRASNLFKYCVKICLECNVSQRI